MPRGRPAGSRRLGSRTERTTVQLRVAPEERAAYERRAAALHLTVSEWLRQLARHDAGLWTGSSVPGDNPAKDD